MKAAFVLAAGILAGAAVPVQAAAAAGGATAAQATVQPTPSAPVQRLQAASQRLREAIQAMSLKPPGPEREFAVAKAREALLQTQTAMLALPPELQTRPAFSGAGYDIAVRKLLAAADELRASIQEMASQPAGPRRNDAIAQANRALLETQAAMAGAYQPLPDASTGRPATGAR